MVSRTRSSGRFLSGMAMLVGLLTTQGGAASYSTDTIRTSHTISKYDGSGGMHVGAAGNLYLNCDWDNDNAGRYITFGTNGSFDPTVLMRIKDDGTVGIGTTSITEKLHVAGNVKCDTIKATVLKVNNTWTVEAPDYVFDAAYPLLGLDEVGRYVKQYKHLPGVASAAEMRADGVDLCEVTMRLLRKVEELTLYALQQHDRINALESTLDIMGADAEGAKQYDAQP
jgi:hypothetical protein